MILCLVQWSHAHVVLDLEVHYHALAVTLYPGLSEREKAWFQLFVIHCYGIHSQRTLPEYACDVTT